MKMLEIKKLCNDDLSAFKQLVVVFNKAFDNKSNAVGADGYLLQLLNKTGFHVFVALIDEQVVGGITACELPSVYKNESEFFIYDIAVHSTYHRKGIGSKLISSVKNYCASNNIKIIFVNADDENAINFYKKTASLFKKVIQFEYNLTT